MSDKSFFNERNCFDRQTQNWFGIIYKSNGYENSECSDIYNTYTYYIREYTIYIEPPKLAKKNPNF